MAYKMEELRVQPEDGEALLRKDPVSLVDCKETVTLTWSDVNVYVKPARRPCCRRQNTNSEPKQIIRNVSGIAKPGSLVWILGASGSGKTTLLNALSTGIDSESFTASTDVRVNGLDVGLGIRNISGYVRQEEIFIPRMTVKEHLTFRALLRMDDTVTRDRRLKRVEEVISDLNLTNCVDTLVGQPGQTGCVSGGERRRLVFAAEILTNPPLLFCDEPTSGLDSYMASNIVNMLSKLADQGKTILCTIHQPSSDVFALFENIMILAQGRIAFAGRKDDALTFFNSFGYNCPIHYNPADHYISTLAIEQGKEDQCKQTIETICDSFERSEWMQACKEDIALAIKTSQRSGTIFEEAYSNSSRYEAPWCEQFKSVMLRAFRTVNREPLFTRVRMIQMICMALVLGIVFFKLDLSQQGVLDINSVIFIISLSLCFSNSNAVINIFIAEKSVFYREYSTGLYRVDVYFLCKNLAEMPVFVLGPTLYACISYFLVGLNSNAMAFVIFWLGLLLSVNVAVSYGYFLSAAIDNTNVILAVAPFTIMLQVLFGGFLLNLESMPVYAHWISYISFLKYTLELLITNQWNDIEHIDCPHAVTNSTACRRCFFTDGESVLQYFSMDKDNFLLDVLVLVGMLIFYRVAALLILWLKARQYKNKHASLNTGAQCDTSKAV